MENSKKNKQLIIRNDINEHKHLANFLGNMGVEWELPGSLIMSVNLALEETVSNVILYAFKSDARDEQISPDFSLEKKQLAIGLTDSGSAYNPVQKINPDITLPADIRPAGGLGIFLIRQLMNDVKCSRNANKNILLMVRKRGSS